MTKKSRGNIPATIPFVGRKGKTVKYFKAFTVQKEITENKYFSLAWKSQGSQEFMFFLTETMTVNICLYKLHDDVSPVYIYNDNTSVKLAYSNWLLKNTNTVEVNVAWTRLSVLLTSEQRVFMARLLEKNAKACSIAKGCNKWNNEKRNRENEYGIYLLLLENDR